MKLKRLFLILISVLFAASMTAREGSAITLGVPDISFDTVPGGSLSYNAITGDLSVIANILSVTGASVTPGGTVNYTMHLTSVDTSIPGVTTGNFGAAAASPDLSVVDGGGTTLLTGDFLSAFITGLNGGRSGYGEATFTVTGGTLAGAFTTPCGGPNCGGMVSLFFNLNHTFSSNMYASSFSGQSKGDIAPVPEPSTLLLLGSGLVGAGFWIRRRRAA